MKKWVWHHRHCHNYQHHHIMMILHDYHDDQRPCANNTLSVRRTSGRLHGCDRLLPKCGALCFHLRPRLQRLCDECTFYFCPIGSVPCPSWWSLSEWSRSWGRPLWASCTCGCPPARARRPPSRPSGCWSRTARTWPWGSSSCACPQGGDLWRRTPRSTWLPAPARTPPSQRPPAISGWLVESLQLWNRLDIFHILRWFQNTSRRDAVAKSSGQQVSVLLNRKMLISR